MDVRSRCVANRQPIVSSVVRSNAVLSMETKDAESSEVWEMWEGEFGEVRDSESGNSGVVTYSEPEGSLHSFPHLTVPGLWCVQLIYLPGYASLNCRN